ncbi:hypothetical protein ACRAKI_29555 [Saccharothrix isguenensis]
MAAWYRPVSEAPIGPLDVWLGDSGGGWTHITTGSDWCLTAEASPPHSDYDMQESCQVEVRPVTDGTPFARHLGEVVLAVREEHHPHAGRQALDIVFTSGRVRCQSFEGDLLLS